MPELTDELYHLINKVRSVVKLFRRSPTKNDDILQKYIKEDFGKEMNLMIDIKIRWNSLLTMLERFDKVKNCILKSLIDLNSCISFDEDELSMIHNLVVTLEPVKLTVEALCRQDATLLSADTAIIFMMNNLGNSHLAARLKESLSRRINQRRTKVSSLLQYLHKGNQIYTALEVDSLLNFERISKATIVSMVSQLSKNLDHNESLDLETGIETTEEEYEIQLTMQEKLAKAIDKEINATINSKSQSLKDVTSIVRKELAIFDVEGKRGAHLEACLRSLNSIPPTSVEPERVFSGCGKTVTKIRSSLNDETIDILTLLRSHFKQNK